MEIVLEIALLLVGFVLLIKGADVFVEGSSAVAKKLKVSSLVIGLTIVSIGTSLPELAVSSVASFQNSNEIAISNVIGSNIFNLLIVLGVSAFFIRIPVKKTMLKREFPFLGIITIVLIFLGGEYLWLSDSPFKTNIFRFDISTVEIGTVNRYDGLLFILIFIGFLMSTVSFSLKERGKVQEESSDTMSGVKCVLYIVGGAIAVMTGGELVVQSAKKLAAAAGMSETLIGLTIVALGTSLPELVTSAVAAKKGEVDIAVGNVVGSNIANILLVLGVSALISPVSVATMALADALISLGVTFIVYLVVVAKRSIKRKDGALFILIYLGYMAYILARQYL